MSCPNWIPKLEKNGQNPRSNQIQDAQKIKKVFFFISDCFCTQFVRFEYFDVIFWKVYESGQIRELKKTSNIKCSESCHFSKVGVFFSKKS